MAECGGGERASCKGGAGAARIGSVVERARTPGGNLPVATTLRTGRGMSDTDSEKSGLFRDAGDGPVPVCSCEAPVLIGGWLANSDGG